MTCPTCQTDNPDQARFCLNCGTALEPARAVEGERKRVTVLFADVVGSTAMAERLDPEEVVDLMNGAFDFMTAAVARYEGTVARLMGDAVLAIFGAPAAHEDDAERAVRAGIDIREEARAYAERVQQQFEIGFNVRVGIDTGLVVVGDVGSALGTEYTAMGDTPNIAARLQTAAEPGTVLISEATYRLVGHAVDVEPRGALAVRGRSLPVVTFEVQGAKAARGSARGLEGVRSPLVGRGSELAHVRDRVEATSGRRGGIVAVLGEAGLGKSRLVTEVREEDAPGRRRWLEGRAVSYGRSQAYFPWRQVLRQSIGARETDAPADVRSRLEREVCTCCRRPGGDLPFLESILAVESVESQRALATLEGADLVEQTADAVKGYLCSLAQLKPTVVVFDDLHWADSASLELLVRMADVVKSYPLLFICIQRPDRAAQSWETLARARTVLDDHYSEVTLEPLDPGKTRELLGNLLHVEDLPVTVRTTILQKAEGNPFFLEEVLRGLIDAGHIVLEDDRWRATHEIVDVIIPDTLAGVLSARIDRLPETTKRVAQTAAVLGRIFEHRVLTDVCSLAPAPERIVDVNPHLSTLTYEELVRERSRLPALEYIFKHALTQETAYDLLLMRRRRELHRRAGEALERFHAERTDEMAPVLARHFWLGEDWERAARYAFRAGNRAAKLFALDDALDLYETALDALEKITPGVPDELVDATLNWVDVALKRRLHEQVALREVILARTDRALQAARDLGDQRRTATVLVAKGSVLTLSGRPGIAFPLLLEASDLATALDDEQIFLLPFFATSEALLDHDPRRAIDVLDQVIALAEKHRDRGIQAHAIAIQAAAYARIGEFGKARELIERALEMAPTSNSIIKEADVHIAAGMVYYELGEVERGIEHAARGGDLAHSVDGVECACAGYAYAGLGSLHAERPQEALGTLGKALALAGGSEGFASQLHPFINQVHAWREIALARRGDLSALARVEEGLANSERAGDEFGAAFLQGELGDLYIENGHFEKAEEHLAAALAYYRRQAMRPSVARTLLSLAVLHERNGMADHAAEARTEAQSFMHTSELTAAVAPTSATHGEAGYPGS